MRDGFTEKLKAVPATGNRQSFFETHRARLVALSGQQAGMEFDLGPTRVTIGRGPGVNLPFDDPAMSRQHAAVDFSGGAFRLHDLGSTNGLRVNGNRVQVEDIEDGDRIEIGNQLFQLVIEEREAEPETYDLTHEG